MKQEMRKNIDKLGTVFIISSILVSLFVLWGTLFPSSLNKVANAALTWMIDNFGWFYMLITALFIFFVVGIAISPYGKVRLGKRNDRPEYSWISWVGMLFAAGIGVGFVFWGVAEPLLYYMEPPVVINLKRPNLLLQGYVTVHIIGHYILGRFIVSLA